MNDISLIQLDSELSAFAGNHKVIQRYFFEAEDQLSVLTTEDESYPILFVTLIPGSTLGYNQNIFRLRFYCLDIIQKDRSNWLTITSDAHLVLNDVYRYFVDGSANFDVLEGQAPIIEWVNDGTNDYTAGVYMDLNIYADTYNDCAIPD